MKFIPVVILLGFSAWYLFGRSRSGGTMTSSPVTDTGPPSVNEKKGIEQPPIQPVIEPAPDPVYDIPKRVRPDYEDQPESGGEIKARTRESIIESYDLRTR